MSYFAYECIFPLLYNINLFSHVEAQCINVWGVLYMSFYGNCSGNTLCLFSFQLFLLILCLGSDFSLMFYVVSSCFSSLIDCRLWHQQIWIIDSPFFSKDSVKEWPPAHPEWCHPQCSVWCPSQHVHSAPTGSCSWGKPQQVKVSRMNTVK